MPKGNVAREVLLCRLAPIETTKMTRRSHGKSKYGTCAGSDLDQEVGQSE